MILSHCQMIQASNDAAARAVAKQSAMPVTVASSTTTSSSSSSSPSSSLFPSKLHAMLEDASEKGFDDIVCWMPGGSSFKVLDTHRFSLSVMPQYFNQRKYKSFLRQLNLYGFARIHHGPHKGGYAHKFFLQGMPDFCERINKDFPRIKEQTMQSHRRVVSTDAFLSTIFEEATMDPERSDSPVPTFASPSSHHQYPLCVGGQNGAAVYDLDSSSSDRSRRSSGSSVNLSGADWTPLPKESPVNTSITREAIQHILPETTHFMQSTPVNEIFHEGAQSFQAMDTQVERALLSTFADTDHLVEKDIGCVPIGLDNTIADDLLAIVNDEHTTPVTMDPPVFRTLPTNVLPTFPITPSTSFATGDMSPLAIGAFSEFNFPRKVYRMLDDVESNPCYKAIVTWDEEGTSFIVRNKKMFVEKILPIYFDMTQYASFRRQLNMYSFERKHTSTYSNPLFMRGCPDLLEKITRKTGSSKPKKSSGKN